METQWCIDAIGTGLAPWTTTSDADVGMVEDQGWTDEAWSLGVAALLGIVAYEGVRRLIGHHRTSQAGSTVPPRPVPSPPTARFARSQPARAGIQGTAPPDTADAVPAAGSDDPDRELVSELLALHDLVPTDALRRRVVRSLGRMGVEPIADVGHIFDEMRHDVMGTTPGSAASPSGTVVEIVREGFVDRAGRVVRVAEVVVATDEDGAW